MTASKIVFIKETWPQENFSWKRSVQNFYHEIFIVFAIMVGLRKIKNTYKNNLKPSDLTNKLQNCLEY